jgi:hypothetical protein
MSAFAILGQTQAHSISHTHCNVSSHDAHTVQSKFRQPISTRFVSSRHRMHVWAPVWDSANSTDYTNFKLQKRITWTLLQRSSLVLPRCYTRDPEILRVFPKLEGFLSQVAFLWIGIRLIGVPITHNQHLLQHTFKHLKSVTTSNNEVPRRSSLCQVTQLVQCQRSTT